MVAAVTVGSSRGIDADEARDCACGVDNDLRQTSTKRRYSVIASRITAHGETGLATSSGGSDKTAPSVLGGVIAQGVNLTRHFPRVPPQRPPYRLRPGGAGSGAGCSSCPLLVWLVYGHYVGHAARGRCRLRTR